MACIYLSDVDVARRGGLSGTVKLLLVPPVRVDGIHGCCCANNNKKTGVDNKLPRGTNALAARGPML